MYLVQIDESNGLFRVHDDNGDPTPIVGRLEVSTLTGFGMGERVRSGVFFVTSPEIQSLVN